MDRVELAYLTRLPDHGADFFALARTPLGYVLLDAAGAAAIAQRIHGTIPWGGADRLSRLGRGRDETVRRAESDLRRHALARCLPNRLVAMLSRHLPPGTSYFNTGHSNLTDRVIHAVRHGARGSIAVLIHDTIPLDFPQFARNEAPGRMRAMLRRVARHADLVICNSQATRDAIEEHLPESPRTRRIVTAHLGVPVPVPDPCLLPHDLPEDPFFVALGTIEPRKGHDLLLDVWDRLTAAPPPGGVPGLMICGTRGWMNDTVFRRLDRLVPGGPVRELPDLPDGATAALLQKSRGLLFPSRAEGFGLPPVEAAALGVPVICSDLGACREILGDIPVYLPPRSCNQWETTIRQATGADVPPRPDPPFRPPTWAGHFDAVLRFA
ncbi:glycosyltransferase family 4 protein [Pukyongiella litopenaei]|uniref:glycosyltransferase family 4 protein n=1 Tax=Pukyongiella litopenaei TaxID=2605946 RepID=UPI001FCF04A7|nr:glycosyltransferase family 1 protein [Pukyongiella litopenaei]